MNTYEFNKMFNAQGNIKFKFHFALKKIWSAILAKIDKKSQIIQSLKNISFLNVQLKILRNLFLLV